MQHNVNCMVVKVFYIYRLGTQIEELGGNPHLTGLIAELKKIYRHSEESWY